MGKLEFVQHELLISVSSEIPEAAGLGSSAAFSCSLSAVYFTVIVNLLGIDVQGTPDISYYADHIENIIHGKASGCDVQIVSRGGCLKFVKNEEDSDQ